MRITDAHVAEFKRLYVQSFKEEISHADAHARLIGLVWLYQNLMDYARKVSTNLAQEAQEAAPQPVPVEPRIDGSPKGSLPP